MSNGSSASSTTSIKEKSVEPNIIMHSPKMKELIHLVDAVADSDSTMLVYGESGTGKELIAERIHARSNRNGHPLVAVNCGAIPSELLESELFGHVKGAFTGAISNREGRFQVAEGGTLFLDEIGEMGTSLQVKLLRVLQTRKFEPVGSTQAINANVRIIAATNRDLEEMVRQGQFREDLFYRLNDSHIRIDSLS
jgi:transcriptional regulator with GAF, ATPase, and Fis domain